MKTIPRALEIVENRVRNRKKMIQASQDIDRLRRKAPVGWNSVEVIRNMRDARK